VGMTDGGFAVFLICVEFGIKQLSCRISVFFFWGGGIPFLRLHCIAVNVRDNVTHNAYF